MRLKKKKICVAFWCITWRKFFVPWQSESIEIEHETQILHFPESSQGSADTIWHDW